MNNEITDTDQADEDILTSTVSDEALEAAANTKNHPTLAMSYENPMCCWLDVLLTWCVADLMCCWLAANDWWPAPASGASPRTMTRPPQLAALS
jgi:hypothetical protein